jgi:hypothetical protein
MSVAGIQDYVTAKNLVTPQLNVSALNNASGSGVVHLDCADAGGHYYELYSTETTGGGLTAGHLQLYNYGNGATITPVFDLTPASGTGGAYVNAQWTMRAAFVAGSGMQQAAGQAIAGAVTLTAATSGSTNTIAQTSAYAIALPGASAITAGISYKFVVTTAGSFNVTISDGFAHLFGTIQNAVTSVIGINGGTTLTIATGAARVGDSIEVTYVDATHIYVKAVTSNATGITVA